MSLCHMTSLVSSDRRQIAAKTSTARFAGDGTSVDYWLKKREQWGKINDIKISHHICKVR